jgi:2-polyprenyl-3-methyl-5-hydroxy-6-metoxy-1,4-benzoquinol methylase
MNFKSLYSGEHLKKINPNWTYENWSYRFSFEEKIKIITNILKKTPKNNKILDAGCGQGLLVERFHKLGYDITGIDAFYGSNLVKKQNILNSNLEDNSFDLILCLDVIEHFELNEQHKLIKELKRVLKPSGKIIWSIPNMAHLSSRVMFALTGNLMRTAKVTYHPGDRPIKEYYNLLKENNLKIKSTKGISPTIPLFFQLTQLKPKQTKWLYSIIKPFSYFASWCFNVIVITKK